MKYKIFDSRDQYGLREEYFENWDTYFPDEEKPVDKHDVRVAKKAWDKMHNDYSKILWSFMAKNIRGYLFVTGYGFTQLGYDPDYEDLTDQSAALQWHSDNLGIYYENGDIRICRDVPYGDYDLKLLIIKPFEDVDVTGLTENQLDNLDEFYGYLDDYDYSDENLGDTVERVFASSVQYFKEFLSEEALKDFEERKAQDPAYYCDDTVSVC